MFALQRKNTFFFGGIPTSVQAWIWLDHGFLPSQGSSRGWSSFFGGLVPECTCQFEGTPPNLRVLFFPFFSHSFSKHGVSNSTLKLFAVPKSRKKQPLRKISRPHDFSQRKFGMGYGDPKEKHGRGMSDTTRSDMANNVWDLLDKCVDETGLTKKNLRPVRYDVQYPIPIPTTGVRISTTAMVNPIIAGIYGSFAYLTVMRYTMIHIHNSGLGFL